MKSPISPDRRAFLASAAAGLVLGRTSLQAEDRRNPRVRVGQIGVGHGHASKLAVYRASADYEVVGIVEPDEKLWERARFQPAYRDLRSMSAEELLAAPGLQAVLIETAVRDSLAVAEACIAAGKHVHRDKPAGQLLPRFQRILNAAIRQGLLLQMGYMYRYNPGIVLSRGFLRNE